MRDAHIRRLLLALLRLYPRSFRRALGDDLVDTTVRRWSDAPRAFWFIELPRFVLDGLLERLKSTSLSPSRRRSSNASDRVHSAPTFSSFEAGLKMLRSPRETPLIVLALSVGVGLTVTAYSLIHAVLVTPLPYSQPEALARVWTLNDVITPQLLLSSDMRDRLLASPSPFRAIASFDAREQSVRVEGAAAADLKGAHVSTNLFEVLGVRAAAGRTLEADDSLGNGTPAVVVSERLLQTGNVSAQLHDIVHLDGVAYRLVGIMPSEFWFPDRQTVFWIAFSPDTDDQPDHAGHFQAVARLADGMTAEAAEGFAYGRTSGLIEKARSDPALVPSRYRVRVEPYASMLAAAVRPSLLALQAASALVLLLVCLNVAWLFVARARRLGPAFATMRALGATRAGVVTTYLVATWIVAAIATPCALLLAWWLLGSVLALEDGAFSSIAEPAITGHVMLVGLVTTILAAVVSSLPGARIVARGSDRLADTVRTSTHRKLFERSGMVAQLGLVFAIGAQAVTFAVILERISRANVGFEKTDFVVVGVHARDGAVTSAEVQLARFRDLLADLAKRGIRAAATRTFPLSGSDNTSVFGPPDVHRRLWNTSVRVRVVTPSYFDITGMKAIKGRLLTKSTLRN